MVGATTTELVNLFLAANLLSVISPHLAVPFAKRIGLTNTRVFTKFAVDGGAVYVTIPMGSGMSRCGSM